MRRNLEQRALSKYGAGAEHQQMPNRSAVSRIDRMYSIGFSNSAALGWNMGASRSSCARKGAGQELAVGSRRYSRGLTGLASSLRALFDGIVASVGGSESSERAAATNAPRWRAG